MTFPFTVGIGPATNTIPDYDLSVFDAWTLGRNIDDGCTFSFTCPGDSFIGQAISELDTDVWVYLHGVLFDRFRVAEVQQQWSADGRDDVTVNAVCYRRILASRFVQAPVTYTATSQGLIVWDLIDQTQSTTNGNLGITLLSSGLPVLRDRSYEIGQNVLEAITDLGKIQGGIVWEIDGLRQLTVTTQDGFPVRSQPIVLGVNVDGMTRPSGAARFANVAITSGDSLATVLQVNTATTLPVDPRGRWERFAAFPQETSQTALVEAADGLLETSQSPAVIWQLSFVPDRWLSESNYNLGDFVTIVPPLTTVAPLGPSLPVQAQIITQEITVTADGDVTVTMTAVETPHPDLATVLTYAATSIDEDEATLNGELIDVGTGTLFAQGFVYSTTPDPVIGGPGVVTTTSSLGVGPFSEPLTGLPDGTTYYVKAYAETTSGTAYGAEVTFTTTPIPPVVTTDPVTVTGVNDATLAGTVTTASVVPILDRGLVYATTASPTIGGPGVTQVSTGAGVGSFSSPETGFATDTVYYVRAYAQTSFGDYYGSDESFWTSLTVEYFALAGGGGGGTTTDRTGGGGGGGGVYEGVAVITPGTSTTMTQGAGGAGGANGSPSAAFGNTVLGGGAGGTSPGTNGATGASGGGGRHNGVGGAGTVGQGNNGGNGYDSGNISLMFGAGGGGGGGAVGANASSSTTGTAGAGGVGATYDSLAGVSFTGGSGGGGAAQRGPSAASYNYGLGGTSAGRGGLAQSEAYAGSVVLANATSGSTRNGGGGGGQAQAGSGATSLVGSGGSGRVRFRYVDGLVTPTFGPGILSTLTGTLVIGGVTYRWYEIFGSGTVTF